MTRSTGSGRRATRIDPEEVLHLAESAPSSPRVDAGQLRDHVDQLALVDAGSGAWDVLAITALEQLPRETEIERLIHRLTREARQGLREVRALGEHRVEQARHRTPGSDGVVRSQPALEAELTDLGEAVAHAQAQRESAGRLLDGDETQDGVRWTGEEPPAPATTSRLALALRPARLRWWFVSIGATLLGGVVEGRIVWQLMYQDLRTDDSLMALSFALPIVLALTLLPHLVGIKAATALRSTAWRRPAAVAAVAGAVWVVALVFLAHQRTEDVRAGSSQRLASDLGVDVAAVPGHLLGSYGWQLGFWMAVLVGIGAGLALLKVVYYNPAVGQALHADAVLALLRPRLVRLGAEKAFVDGVVAVQQLAAKENETAWAVFLELTLPALREELLARYRNQLICALQSPEATTAIATTPTAAAGAPASVVVLPAPAPAIDDTEASGTEEVAS